jgi:hypothetical protein
MYVLRTGVRLATFVSRSRLVGPYQMNVLRIFIHGTRSEVLPGMLRAVFGML